MKNVKNKRENLAIPGEPLTDKEFLQIIREAEKGPFKSVAHLKKDVLSAWKKKYAK